MTDSESFYDLFLPATKAMREAMRGWEAADTSLTQLANERGQTHIAMPLVVSTHAEELRPYLLVKTTDQIIENKSLASI